MDFQLHTIFPMELEQEWNALLDESVTHVPFLRHEYLKTWWQNRGGGEWPDAELALVTARRDGQLTGIAPLFMAVNPQGQRALLLLGSIEISDYLDLIVRPDDLDPFLTELLAFLDTPALGDWDVLDLYNLIDSSPTLSGLERACATLSVQRVACAGPFQQDLGQMPAASDPGGYAAGQGWAFQSEKLHHSPYIPLPGDWDTYLAHIDKKQRHEIRRKIRRAEESGAEVRWYFATDPAQQDADIHAFIDLMRQDPDKEAFFARSPAMVPTMIEIARCAFEHSCLALAFLEVNGKKAAGYLCFDYLNRVWVYNSGIDRTLMEYSPGWVLLGYLLQWANQAKRSEFDFMRGDEEYKYRFGAVDRFVVRAVVTRK